MSEPQLFTVSGSFPLCSACLDGKGGECHTPGCVMWLNRAPDLSLRANFQLHECRVRLVGAEPCTGVAASWCHHCGDCSCPRSETGERAEDSDDCPLHGSKSMHAEPEADE